MGDIGKYGNYIVAVVFFVVGLHLLGIIPMPWSGPGQVGMKRKGLLSAFILGLILVLLWVHAHLHICADARGYI